MTVSPANPSGEPSRTPRASVAAIALFFAVLLNSAYLVGSASPTLFYFANVGGHALLGLAAAVAALAWWRRTRPRRDALTLAAFGLLGLGLLLGLVVLKIGATTPLRGWLQAHVAASASGTVLLVVWLLRRAGALGHARRRALSAGLAVTAVAFVWAGVTAWRYDGVRRAAYRIENPRIVPASMQEEGAGAASPFFPSSSTTNTRGIIPATFFLTSEACGRCHRDVYEQWNSSTHHFSSFNNQWYRRSIEYMQDVVGTKPSKWCAGCHDHAVFFNGRFDRPIREQVDTREAQAGLACTSCHSITHVGSTMGQGHFEIEYPPLHDLAASERPLLRWAHDKLLELDPQPHREAFLKPFHREQTPEFCSSCHKVHLDVPVNSYRWFRGFNDYDNWQASGVSGEGARSFYYPPKPQKCADCHMPLVDSTDPAAKNGKIRSHRFAAANTALPYVNGDRAQLEAVQRFLRDGQISVDVFGLVRGDAASFERAAPRASGETQIATTFAVGEEALGGGAAPGVVVEQGELVAPLDKVDAVVRRGESVRLEVVVRTRKVGHFFPGGTVDAFDVWVELEAVDDAGKLVMHSGWTDDQGRGAVEPGAHFYRSLLLDGEGNPINKRNAWMARSVAYVRLIPPGAADTVHYRLRIPPDAGNRITLRAKVNYRKFAWWNTQWAFAGVRDAAQTDLAVGPARDNGRWLFTGDTSRVSGKTKGIPDIPTTVMAETASSLRVVGRRDALPARAQMTDASVRERWNDYGIGLLLQGDLRGAERAFLRVTEMDPKYADGWVNVARVRVQEGNMEGAIEMLERALALDAELAKTHFFMGTALKAQGKYDDALGHLRQAAAKYPRDRVVRNQIARVLFLQRHFRLAVDEAGAVLSIDPEDLQAHYTLMLAARGLGDTAMAERERLLYERFKADEAAQSITGPYRQLHPHDNNERQAIHEHGGDLMEGAAPRAKSPRLQTDAQPPPRGARGSAPVPVSEGGR